jgi:O-antigen ligase
LKVYSSKLTGDVLHALVILTTFALLGTQNLVHYPFALMSVIGLCLIAKNLSVLFEKDSQKIVYIFALVWSPMLLSLPDAVNLMTASQSTFSYLHYFFGAYYIYWACCRQKTYKLVGIGVGLLVLFALLDGFLQFMFAKDLFGFPYDREVLKGLFYPKERLGFFLAVLFPLALYLFSGKRYKFLLYSLMVPLVLFILLLCMKRSAWVMFGLTTAGVFYLIYMNSRTKKRIITISLAAAAVCIFSIAAIIYSPTFATKKTLISSFSSGHLEEIDMASNYRVSLWRTGSNMFLSHPFNGIGVRGYRHVYARYAGPDDFWLTEGRRGQNHPHLQLLEIAVETGVIGLLGFLCIYLFFIRELYHQAGLSLRAIWVLALLVAWFPLNTHMAFYGSYWSSFAWLLIPIALAKPSLGLSLEKEKIGTKSI